MEVISTIRLGRPGSIRFPRHCEGKLAAERYPRDATAPNIYTTVEFNMDERELAPPRTLLLAVHPYTWQQLVVAANV